LIGLLVVIVIIIGMYMMFIGPRQGKNGEMRPSVAKESIERAKEVGVGSNNAQQIGMCIEAYKSDNNGQVPPDLPALKAYCKEIPSPMWVNPTDGRPYAYDPSTGRIYPSTEAPAGAAPAAAAPAPGAPAAAPAAPAPAPLPGNRGPGGVRLPDMQPRTSGDMDQ
jgi:hypothetical protein